MTPPEPLPPDLAALVEPLDHHNRELVDNVHPSGWINPEPQDRYHLVVLGAGTGGLVSAAIGAALGARVALIERRLMGGDCLNHGCVPSKALIAAARSWQEARRSQARFGGPEVAGEGDFATVMERMRRLRAGISHHDSAERFRDLGVDVFLGEGRFTGRDTVQVGDRELRFRRAIIATGGRPTKPGIAGFDEAGYFTNETIFSLTELPRRLGVIGAGPIGCELAQVFARFGSEVTVFDLAPQILINEDPDAAQVVQDAMRAEGIAFELGCVLERIEVLPTGKILVAEEKGHLVDAEVDEILLAVGRTPSVEGLGLEEAGVAFHARTGVDVDDRLRTTNRRIYAVGDVASRYQFTHVADAQAAMAVQNALFFGRARASKLVIPWCTYTNPEIAHVGLYARDAAQRGLEVDTITVQLADVDRAILEDTTEGFLRIHLKRGTDRILGATLVAEHAGEIISELTAAITNGIGLGKLASTIHPYPTRAEVIRKAANEWRKARLTPTAKRVLGVFFRIFR